MGNTTAESAARLSPGRMVLSPGAAVMLAIALGLCGGYLDLLAIVFKKYCWNDQKYFWNARDFPWTVPAGHAILLLILGFLVAGLNRLHARLISPRVGTWLFASLAIWGALLRMPLYGVCSFILAVGLGRPISGVVAAGRFSRRHARAALAGLLGVLIVLAGLSSGRAVMRERRAAADLPAPPPGARNVLLIVWDTVRSYNLSAYGWPRNTTPNLALWARKGVRYKLALAPAPWTYPSHSSFFTGRWPYQLNSQWTFTLDAPDPTLAEYLSARGYQTVGYAANTNCCSYETGLDRGFGHFEDYPLSPWYFLSRTIPGSWILENVFARGDYYAHKWIRLQSRDARGVSQAFLDWLPGRRRDRPFLAFLNYFDAHDPYVPPAGYVGRSGGLQPRSPRDYQVLLNYKDTNKERMGVQDILMAHDCYDDCITYLDDQLGRLLADLQGQGLLENTLVIVMSDHGEAFGDHGVFGHASSVYLDELAVPLVIRGPGVPAGRVVAEPVSLRDLPATVVDLLGLSAGAPFPGRSLAAYWQSGHGPSSPNVSPALSEVANATAFQDRRQQGLSRRGFQMSLVADGRHYVRDGMGPEQLYDLTRDPFEHTNLAESAAGQQAVDGFRRMLLELLTANPGSAEVEGFYLSTYRRWLERLVQRDSQPRDGNSMPGSVSVSVRE